jgi:hypothetical protein
MSEGYSGFIAFSTTCSMPPGQLFNSFFSTRSGIWRASTRGPIKESRALSMVVMPHTFLCRIPTQFGLPDIVTGPILALKRAKRDVLDGFW